MAIDARGGFKIHDVTFSEFQVLHKIEMAIAPVQRDFDWSLQGAALLRFGFYLIERGVGFLFRGGIFERERKRPRADLPGGGDVNQLERLRRLVVGQIFFQLPALDQAASIGDLHAIERTFDYRDLLVGSLDRAGRRREHGFD